MPIKGEGAVARIRAMAVGVGNMGSSMKVWVQIYLVFRFFGNLVRELSPPLFLVQNA